MTSDTIHVGLTREELLSDKVVDAAREALPLELPTARFTYRPTDEEAAQAVEEERRIVRELLENLLAALQGDQHGE